MCDNEQIKDYNNLQWGKVYKVNNQTLRYRGKEEGVILFSPTVYRSLSNLAAKTSTVINNFQTETDKDFISIKLDNNDSIPTTVKICPTGVVPGLSKTNQYSSGSSGGSKKSKKQRKTKTKKQRKSKKTKKRKSRRRG